MTTSELEQVLAWGVGLFLAWHLLRALLHLTFKAAGIVIDRLLDKLAEGDPEIRNKNNVARAELAEKYGIKRYRK